MRKMLGYQLLACGRKGLPEKIKYNQSSYCLEQVLKHDFFAATGLYQLEGSQQLSEKSNPKKIILKINRRQHFLGIPLFWLGWLLCAREVSILKRLTGLTGVPCFLERYNRTGFIYEYIYGCTLDEQKNLPDDFFDKLFDLIKQIHKRNIVYFDLNKRGNIILGSDGQPYIIDFQTSRYIGPRFLIGKAVTKHLRDKLQKTDIYHLFKHKRRFCPDSLTAAELALAHSESSRLIRIHRFIANPFRKLRRSLLRFLYVRGFIITEENTRYSSENDPERYLK